MFAISRYDSANDPQADASVSCRNQIGEGRDKFPQNFNHLMVRQGRARRGAAYTKAILGSEILGIERYGKAGPGPEGSVMLVRFRSTGRNLWR